MNDKKKIFYMSWWVVVGLYYCASVIFISPESLNKMIDLIVKFIPFIAEYYKSSPFPEYTKGILLISFAFMIISLYMTFFTKKRVINYRGTFDQYKTDIMRAKFVLLLYIFVFVSLGYSELISQKYEQHWFGSAISGISKNKLYHSILYTLCFIAFCYIVDLVYYNKTQYED
ncbi:hypothetical protein CW740_08425 [Kangiella profundi]|uniref:Uncharacterized protein n=1 Tax=Kangiella profundi TaxID=1561924 RepID=A0A2K9B2X1_9GAMM|nr:hypothetical protein [Kangiella profundi]AUD79268.1 hypothetical protein CW740_08425 [Kangiella profundi]